MAVSTIQGALRDRLINDTSVTNEVAASKIVPWQRWRGQSTPAVTYQVISQQHFHTYSDVTDLKDARVQYDCWADSYAKSWSIARALRDSLAAHKGSHGTITIQFVWIDDLTDQPDNPVAAEESSRFRVKLDVIAAYR